MNEELRYESEKLNLNIHKVQSEKAQTQELRKEDYQILEATQLRVDKQTKVINKICRDIAKVKHLVSTIAAAAVASHRGKHKQYCHHPADKKRLLRRL